MNAGKALLGILAGVAAGALIGILFAPAKGTETRKKIAKKGKDYADDLTVKLNDLMEDVSEKVDSVVKKVKDLTVKEPEDFSSVN